MPTPSSLSADQKSLTILSRLLLPPGQVVGGTPNTAAIDPALVQLDREAFDNLVALASSNHVIVRAMEVFLLLTKAANDTVRTEWAETALAEERSRIQVAMSFLKPICAAFDEEGKDVTVIKSLDHWPDLGQRSRPVYQYGFGQGDRPDASSVWRDDGSAKLGRPAGAQVEL